MDIANSSRGAPMGNTAAGARSTNQPLVVAFERDESLAGSLLGLLRAQGYESRAAKTPVEVFDLIARYPVGLVLVNLGQAATGRREFWVALDSQRRGRGVQVVTYRNIIPGVEPEGLDGGRAPLADVEIRGAQGFGALVDAVRARLPVPAQPAPDAAQAPGGPVSHTIAGVSHAYDTTVTMPPPDQGGRQPIAGVLDLRSGAQSGQPSEFAPLPSMPGMPPGAAANGAGMPSTPGTPPMDPRVAQWMAGYTGGPAAPPAAAPDRPTAPGPAMPEQNDLPGSVYSNGNGARGAQPMNGQQGGANGASHLTQDILSSPMPMGDLAGLTDAINALAAAGAPGYHQAAAAANAINAEKMQGQSEAARWQHEAARSGQDAAPMGGWGTGNPETVSRPVDMSEMRGSSGQMPAMQQAPYAQQNGRNPAETLYMGQQAFEELRRSADTRSRALADRGDEFDFVRPESTSRRLQGNEEDTFPSTGRRSSGGMGLDNGGGPSATRQNQSLARMPATSIERSLGTVLVEGQLVSQQRLEVAMGIQRLLRGVDIDYRLGEVLLLFKFLTPDQLLAALLVSRGLVSPAQVAAMGRIKQELHAIGMEYDLENLLILFRLLSSEQLREIRSEFP